MESAVVRSNRVQRWDYEVYGSLAQAVEQALQSSTWPIASLRQVSTRIWCGSTPRSGSSIERADGTPFIKTFNVQEGRLDLSSIYRVSPDAVANQSERLARPGDVLFNIIGATLEVVGRATVVPEELEKAYLNQNVAAIRLRKDVNPQYISICLQTQLLKRQIAAHSKQGNQVNFSTEEVRSLRIPLPPRPIQDQIAAIMQEAYATRRAMLAEAEKLLGGIDDYVLAELGIELTQIPGEKRFVVNAGELLGHRFEVDYYSPKLKAQYRALQNGLYPVVELGTLTSEMSGGATPLGARYLDEGIPFLRIQNITESRIDLSDVRYISEETHQQMERSQTRPGDLLMTITGRVGTAAVVPPGLPEANTNQHMVIIRLAEDQVSPHYLATVINSSIVAFQVQHKTTGTTRVALDYKSIRSLLVPVPPSEVQEAIVLAVQDRQKQAERLRVKAQESVSEAKERAERIILGEEDVG